MYKKLVSYLLVVSLLSPSLLMAKGKDLILNDDDRVRAANAATPRAAKPMSEKEIKKKASQAIKKAEADEKKAITAGLRKLAADEKKLATARRNVEADEKKALKLSQKKVDRAQRDLNTAEKKLKGAEANIKNAEGKKDRIANELNALKLAVAPQTKKIDSVQKKLDREQKALLSAQTKLAGLKPKVDSLKTSHENATRSHQLLKDASDAAATARKVAAAAEITAMTQAKADIVSKAKAEKDAAINKAMSTLQQMNADADRASAAAARAKKEGNTPAATAKANSDRASVRAREEADPRNAAEEERKAEMQASAQAMENAEARKRQDDEKDHIQRDAETKKERLDQLNHALQYRSDLNDIDFTEIDLNKEQFGPSQNLSALDFVLTQVGERYIEEILEFLIKKGAKPKVPSHFSDTSTFEKKLATYLFHLPQVNKLVSSPSQIEVKVNRNAIGQSREFYDIKIGGQHFFAKNVSSGYEFQKNCYKGLEPFIKDHEEKRDPQLPKFGSYFGSISVKNEKEGNKIKNILIFEKANGISIDELINNNIYTLYKNKADEGDKIGWFKQIGSSLAHFYTTYGKAYPFGFYTMSHGDAHTGNLLFDTVTRKTTFIDYDGMHMGLSTNEELTFLSKNRYDLYKSNLCQSARGRFNHQRDKFYPHLTGKILTDDEAEAEIKTLAVKYVHQLQGLFLAFIDGYNQTLEKAGFGRFKISMSLPLD